MMMIGSREAGMPRSGKDVVVGGKVAIGDVGSIE